MVRLLVTLGRYIPMSRHGEKTGMLARAIVEQARRLFTASDHRFGDGLVTRGVRTACEIILAQAQAREPGGNARGVHRLAGVRGAGECNFLVAQSESLGRAALDERQRLYRLERGSRIDRRVDIAERETDISPGIRDGERTAMHALDH